MGEVKQHYFCHENGNVYTLEKLFKKKKVKAIRRVVGRDGHATFYLCEDWNPRWKSGTCWKLTEPELVVKAIKLAKQRKHIKFYREEW